MKASTIKWLDRKLGVPLCFLLSGLNALLPRKERKPKRIAFIKLIEQGASVLAYSALKYSVDKYGKKNIFFLVFSENRFILDQLNVLDHANIIEIKHDHLGSFFWSSVAAISRMRREKIDSCVDLEFFSRASAIFAFLSGSRNRVGLHRFQGEQPYRGNLISHRLIYSPYLHVSKYYLLMCLALEEKASKEPLLKIPSDSLSFTHPQLNIEPVELSRVATKFKIEGGRKLVILNPNAGDMLPLRKWESDKFGSLAQGMEQLPFPVQILFTGVEKEANAIEEIIEKYSLSNAINLAGKTSFPDLMALYERSDLLVTNDSGPAHFASLFNTRFIVLFVPEYPYLYALSDPESWFYQPN
jgi:ADP-heptose:LPS heptosyltransferase